MKVNSGVITKLKSNLIIKMHNIEYFISIIEINNNLKGEKYKPEIKNKENIGVGVFFIADDRKNIKIIIGSVPFTSDLEDLKKLINNQLFEIPIYSDRPDSSTQVMGGQKFSSASYHQKITIIDIETQTPLNSSFRDTLKMKFYLTTLWHFTHLENLESILNNGLFSRNESQKRSLLKVDISDEDIQKHRTEYHDFVPLFFAACPPIVYRIMNDNQKQIVAIAIDPKIMDDKKIIFSDGNVRVKHTKKFSSLTDLDELKWDLIHLKPSEIISFQTADKKRERGAEVLVKDVIPLTYIKSLSVHSQETYNIVKEILKKENLDIPVFINLEISGVNLLNQ